MSYNYKATPYATAAFLALIAHQSVTATTTIDRFLHSATQHVQAMEDWMTQLHGDIKKSLWKDAPTYQDVQTLGDITISDALNQVIIEIQKVPLTVSAGTPASFDATIHGNDITINAGKEHTIRLSYNNFSHFLSAGVEYTAQDKAAKKADWEETVQEVMHGGVRKGQTISGAIDIRQAVVDYSAKKQTLTITIPKLVEQKNKNALAINIVD